MAFDAFKKKLQDPKSPEHAGLLKHLKGLIDISRLEMAQHYTKWDEHNAVFESKRKRDKEDKAAESKGQPKKMVVPLTFAQCMAYVAFNVMTVTQNKRFFQLEPTGTEDTPLREPMELILERDLRKNKMQAYLVQIFLDIARFSIGCSEVCYEESYRNIRLQQQQTVQGAFGESTTTVTNPFTQVPVFIGNRLVPVSPYRFFPDTRIPLTRFNDGEFCGSEDMWSVNSLKSNSECFNTDKIPKFTKEQYTARRVNSRIVEMEIRPESGTEDSAADDKAMVKRGPVAVTKLVVDITPKDLELPDKSEALGEEDFPIRYIAWYANDKTIVRFEEAQYLHGQFPYLCAQFIPDQHNVVNQGLADVCEQLTGLITWKLNAHITSQKNSVESKWIVDPAGIDVKSLESRSPYIYLRKNASQTGVDRYIKQFATQDVTQMVMQDTAALKELLESVSGYNAMMQGAPSTGRRSATQDRATIQGAGARGKTQLGSVWDTFFEPMGKQLIANNRQEMTFETFQRILGPQWKTVQVNPDTGMPWMLEELFVLFKADPITIATSEDFFVFDGSNPSENAFLAQSLQEILMTILQNPEVGAVLGYGPPQIQALFNEIYTLRGVTQSRLPAPTPQPMLMQPPGQPGQPGAPANVVPGPGVTAAANV